MATLHILNNTARRLMSRRLSLAWRSWWHVCEQARVEDMAQQQHGSAVGLLLRVYARISQQHVARAFTTWSNVMFETRQQVGEGREEKLKGCRKWVDGRVIVLLP